MVREFQKGTWGESGANSQAGKMSGSPGEAGVSLGVMTGASGDGDLGRGTIVP